MTTPGRDAERLAARMVCCGIDGHEVNDHARRLLARGVGAFILFARNVDTPRQVLELNAGLKTEAGERPVLCGVDQEGGRVRRLRDGFSPVPALRDLATPEAAARAGDVLGRECRAVGFDLDFAPVLDVDTNPANPVIADRSFGRDPAHVAACGVAMLTAMQAHVAACGKHFPGHGDTHLDSHHDLPTLPHDLARLRAVELPPFKAAVDAGLSAVMTAHIVFPALDPDRPATMSPAVLRLLRADLGFGGVIVSDDLLMKAVHEQFPWDEIVVGAATAGVDLLCVCHGEEPQHEAIDLLAARVPIERLREANARLDELCRRYCKPADATADLSMLGSATSEAVAQADDPTENWRPKT